MKNNFKRCLAMLLAIMMVVGACAFPISAADDTNATQTPETIPCEKCDKMAELVDEHEGTCTSQAYKLYRCEAGHDFMTEVGDFGEHDWVWREKVDDTCEEGVVGYDAGYQCNVCENWKVTNEPVDAKCGAACKEVAGTLVHDVYDAECIHTWKGNILDGSTCVSGNVTITYTCEVCKITQDVENSGTGHKYEFIWDKENGFAPPTCVDEGRVRRVCTVCPCAQECLGEEVIIVIAPLGHDFTYTNSDPADTQHNQDCSRCDKFDGLADHTPDINASNYLAATCGVAGKATCLDCHVEYVIPATQEHDYTYNEGTPVYADCISEGTRVDTCVCGATNTVKVAKQGHAYNTDPDEVIEPSHTYDEKTGEDTLTDGLKTWYCTRCDDASGVETKIIEAEHDFPNGFEYAQDVTCVNHPNKQLGIKVGVCTCGYVETKVEQPFECYFDPARDPKDIVKTEYNCVDGGYNFYKCVSCGKGVKDTENPLAPNNHIAPDNFVTTTNPGHNKPGLQVKICQRDGCNQILDSKPLDPTSVCDIKDGEYKFVYGDTCLTGWYKYSYCTVDVNCPYYFDTTLLNGKTDKEKQDILDAAFKNNDDLKENYEFISPIGHSVDLENAKNLPDDQLKVIRPVTCSTDGVLGVECEHEGCPLPDNERIVGVKTIDHEDYPHNHGTEIVTVVDGKTVYNWMDLDQFIWSCGANDVLQMKSVYRCVKCNAKEILVTSYVPKEGIEFVISDTVEDFSDPDSVVTAADTARFTKEVRVVKIYVNGVLKTELDATNNKGEKFTIPATENGMVAGNGHVYKETTKPSCFDDGEETCVICAATRVVDKTNAHVLENYIEYNCEKGHLVECTTPSCPYQTRLDPVDHTEPAFAYRTPSAPSCKGEVEWTGKCTVCNADIKGTYPKKNTHTITVVVAGVTITLFDVSNGGTLDNVPYDPNWDFVDEPTCDDPNGTAKWVCTECGEDVILNVQATIPHVYEEVVLKDKSNLVAEATCSTKAEYKKVCKCGLESETETFFDGDVANHVYINYVDDKNLATYRVSEATCCEYAKYNPSCKWECGAIDATVTFDYVDGGYADHDSTNTTNFNPTIAIGLCVEYTFDSVDYCGDCGAVLTIYGLDGNYGHKQFEKADHKATCLRPAYKEYVCEYCGDYDSATMDWENEVEYGDKDFHKNKWGYNLTNHCKYFPLDLTNGLQYNPDGTPVCDYECDTCKETFLPNEHDWGDWEEDATNKHLSTRFCPTCKKEEPKTTPCDSKIEEIITPATEEQSGLKSYFCSICGKKQSDEEIPATKSISFELQYEGINGSDVVVNGGKVYVTVKITSTADTKFSAGLIKLNVNPAHLQLVGVVDGTSMFKAEPYASQDNGTVTVYDQIGSKQEPVEIPADNVYCVLEFNVIYTGIPAQGNDDCDRVAQTSSISFASGCEIKNYNKVSMGIKSTTGASMEIEQIGDFDQNGSITVDDALALLEEIEKTFTEGNATYYNAIADINRDGVLDNKDLTAVRKFIAGITKTYEEFAGFDNE